MHYLRLLFIVAFSGPFILAAQSVTYFYQLLSDYDNDIKIHQLSKQDEQWQVLDNNGQALNLYIDESNNFLELKDKEVGGIFTMQVALLKKNKGDILIALAKNHMDLFLHGEIHILRYQNGRFFDITEEVMPTINYQDFTDKTQSLATNEFNPELNQHLEFGFQLPKDGQKAYAKMQTDVIQHKCEQQDNAVLPYCQSLKEIAYSSIELIWNPKKGTFSVGLKE
jgi:hypothetical protein